MMTIFLAIAGVGLVGIAAAVAWVWYLVRVETDAARAELQVRPPSLRDPW
jgi:hypothetical protein